MTKKHKGFYMDVDGEPAHFLADPDMTPETKAALEAVVRAVRKRMDADEGDGLRVCEVCKQYECVAPATKCWRCKEQDVIDAEPWLDEPNG